MGYDGTYGSVSSSYDYSQDSQRLNYGIKGGILAHSDGITFSQELGETVALVKAPGAAGLDLENGTGAATDWRGYTVQTQLNPYDENRVEIDSDYFEKANVELENSVLSLIPTRGAVVKAEFVTHVGYRVLFNVRQKNGKPVPFGAMASAELESGSVTGIVGDEGDLYLSGMPEDGSFQLNWEVIIAKNVLCIISFLSQWVSNWFRQRRSANKDVINAFTNSNMVLIFNDVNSSVVPGR